MSLSKELQKIIDKYKFNKAERQALDEYLTEEIKQTELEMQDLDFDYEKANKLYKNLSPYAGDFVLETAEYMTAWRYSNTDIAEALKDIKDEL